jgi:hypothetical protein
MIARLVLAGALFLALVGCASVPAAIGVCMIETQACD